MSDAHPQGGDLFDMAKEGTKVPADAAKPNVVPSGEGRPGNPAGGLGSSGLDQPAMGGSSMGEIVSAAGELPEDVGQKYSRSGGKQRGEQQATPHGGRNQPSH